MRRWVAALDPTWTLMETVITFHIWVDKGGSMYHLMRMITDNTIKKIIALCIVTWYCHILCLKTKIRIWKLIRILIEMHTLCDGCSVCNGELCYNVGEAMHSWFWPCNDLASSDEWWFICDSTINCCVWLVNTIRTEMVFFKCSCLILIMMLNVDSINQKYW